MPILEVISHDHRLTGKSIQPSCTSFRQIAKNKAQEQRPNKPLVTRIRNRTKPTTIIEERTNAGVRREGTDDGKEEKTRENPKVPPPVAASAQKVVQTCMPGAGDIKIARKKNKWGIWSEVLFNPKVARTEAAVTAPHEKYERPIPLSAKFLRYIIVYYLNFCRRNKHDSYCLKHASVHH